MFPGGFCGGTGALGWALMIGFWTVFLGLVVWAVARLFPTGRRSNDRGR